MAVAYSTFSLRDNRSVPLFPCICGDDGEVSPFKGESFARRRHEVYSDAGCLDRTVCYLELDCVRTSFRRLGPDSRALVMSLYRAIVERFFIMRSVGDGLDRPTGDPDCIFDYDSRFLYDNSCEAKRKLAGENMRRAFGGVFRDTLKRMAAKYSCTGGSVSRGCVHFYPYTPLASGGESAAIVPEATEYPDGSAIRWWESRPVGDSCHSCWYTRILGTFSGGSREWTYDNSMQNDIRCDIRQTQGEQALRPLLRDLACAYTNFMVDTTDVGCVVRRNLNEKLPFERKKSITDCGASLSSYCHIHDFKTAIGRFFDSCDCMWPPRFWLPALGLALRMLSVLTVQTVRRGSGCVVVPHKRVTARYELAMGVDGACIKIGPEECIIDICDVDCSGSAVVCGSLSYMSGLAFRPVAELYVDLSCRQPSNCNDPGYILPNCILSLRRRLRYGGGVCGTPAVATLRAIWPDLSGGRFQFGGPAYPARWAVRECDVFSGTVSAFVWGDCRCRERAWVANQTLRPKDKLGGCRDLMSVLGRELIKAGLQRVMCDKGATTCGNTFRGTNFPATAGAVTLEMVGERKDANIGVVRDIVNKRNKKGADDFVTVVNVYHHYRLGDCGEKLLGFMAEDESVPAACFPRLSPLPQGWPYGEWYSMFHYPADSVSFDYKNNYVRVSDCFMCVCHVRHAWNAPRSSVHFGGFFGTFVFNNRAARQMP